MVEIDKPGMIEVNRIIWLLTKPHLALLCHFCLLACYSMCGTKLLQINRVMLSLEVNAFILGYLIITMYLVC